LHDGCWFAGFSDMKNAMEKTVALMEFMADQPTGEPAQTPKDGLKTSKKGLEKYLNQ